jgi:hypothetical protein
MMPSHKLSPQEKRREPRRPASGTVRVRLSEPAGVEFEGQLMDVSPGGFRMSHHFTLLAAGQIVDFSHPESAGRARVVWNRILAAQVETGFLVLG